MPGLDNLVWNGLERLLSTDLNNGQALLDRVVQDTLRRLTSQPVYGNFAGPMTSAIRNVVLGGMEVTPSGNDVQVAPGVLLQDSGTLVPVPGPLDSTYRVGIQRAPVVVDLPDPGVTTYYLIEAQVSQVTTLSEVRDIYDPGTDTWTPTNVPKQREFQIAYQVVAGGPSAPAPSGGNWVPIAIVRRPAGGGASAQTDIHDVRMLASELAPMQVSSDVDTGGVEYTAARYRTAGIVGTASNNVLIYSAVSYARAVGFRTFVLGAGDVDITAAAFLEPGLVLAASTWYYVYAVPWNGLPVRNGQTGFLANAVLVLSDSAPVRATGGGDPLNPISLPAPFNTSGGPHASSARLVCALRRNAANTGWISQECSDGKHHRLGQDRPTLATLAPPAAGDNAIVGATTIPTNAREAIVRVVYDGAGGAPAPRTLSVNQTGASGFSLDGARYVDDGGGIQGELEFRVPLEALNATGFDLNLAGGAPNAGTVATVYLQGWTY